VIVGTEVLCKNIEYTKSWSWNHSYVSFSSFWSTTQKSSYLYTCASAPEETSTFNDWENARPVIFFWWPLSLVLTCTECEKPIKTMRWIDEGSSKTHGKGCKDAYKSINNKVSRMVTSYTIKDNYQVHEDSIIRLRRPRKLISEIYLSLWHLDHLW